MGNSNDQYTARYKELYDFEKVLVTQRQRLLIERIRKYGPQTVVEVGSGIDSLYSAYLKKFEPLKKWVVVEPSKDFLDNIKKPHSSMVHVNGFLENTVEVLKSTLGKGPDFIILSALLHEVDDPKLMFQCLERIASSHSIIHVNVPNADSFHRQLAVVNGMIERSDELSERNVKLFQKRVFNFDSLRRFLCSCNCFEIDSGAYFIKPFTHSDMFKIMDVLTDDVLDGLYGLGKIFPELASEIFCEVKFNYG